MPKVVFDLGWSHSFFKPCFLNKNRLTVWCIIEWKQFAEQVVDDFDHGFDCMVREWTVQVVSLSSCVVCKKFYKLST
jgi:hypothetical protein